MKTIRIIPTIAIILVTLVLIAGCASDQTEEPDRALISDRTAVEATPLATGYLGFPHWVDVYINDAKECFTVGNVKVNGAILLFEGDYLIYNNIGKEKVTLELPEGWFEESEVTIEPNKRKALKVIIKGPAEGDIAIIGEEMIRGTPNMKVGEEP